MIRRGTSWFAILAALALALPSLPGALPEPKVDVRTEKDRITVGEHFQLILEATYPTDLVVKMPGTELDLGPFEIIGLQPLGPESTDADQLTSSILYTLTAFETGSLEIPSITIEYISNDGSGEGRLETKPLSVTVESVVTDQGSEIRDVKPPMEIPRDWLPILLTLLLIAVLGLGGFWAWRRYSSRKQLTVGSKNTGPPIPPHVLALEELERLQRSRLLDRGEVQRFHVEVSEIIRRYFEGRYRINALEMTSSEIVRQLSESANPVARLSNEFLGHCDLVKFAKHVPLRPSSDRALEMAFQIVKETSPASPGDDISGLSSSGAAPERVVMNGGKA